MEGQEPTEAELGPAESAKKKKIVRKVIIKKVAKKKGTVEPEAPLQEPEAEPTPAAAPPPSQTPDAGESYDDDIVGYVERDDAQYERGLKELLALGDRARKSTAASSVSKAERSKEQKAKEKWRHVNTDDLDVTSGPSVIGGRPSPRSMDVNSDFGSRTLSFPCILAIPGRRVTDADVRRMFGEHMIQLTTFDGYWILEFDSAEEKNRALKKNRKNNNHLQAGLLIGDYAKEDEDPPARSAWGGGDPLYGRSSGFRSPSTYGRGYETTQFSETPRAWTFGSRQQGSYS